MRIKLPLKRPLAHPKFVPPGYFVTDRFPAPNLPFLLHQLQKISAESLMLSDPPSYHRGNVVPQCSRYFARKQPPRPRVHCAEQEVTHLRIFLSQWRGLIALPYRSSRLACRCNRLARGFSRHACRLGRLACRSARLAFGLGRLVRQCSRPACGLSRFRSRRVRLVRRRTRLSGLTTLLYRSCT